MCFSSLKRLLSLILLVHILPLFSAKTVIISHSYLYFFTLSHPFFARLCFDSVHSLSKNVRFVKIRCRILTFKNIQKRQHIWQIYFKYLELCTREINCWDAYKNRNFVRLMVKNLKEWSKVDIASFNSTT